MIFVERFIRGELEEVWRITQDPKLHERWDLRFSTIEYSPPGKEGVQRFTYTTRLGFGLVISGWGESVGAKLEDGKRTSALKFGSDERLSLITRGSGYWQYEQEGPHVRFHTVYDYQVRFGRLGRIVDSCVFRPLMSWATALSFDQLALWIERGVAPETTFRSWIILRISSLVQAFVWAYHGLVPKLLSREAEMKPILKWGIPVDTASFVVTAFTVVEVVMAICFLFFYRKSWPWILTVVAMPILAVGAVLSDPSVAIAPFNPVTLNILMAGMAVIGFLARKDASDVARCTFSCRWNPK